MAKVENMSGELIASLREALESRPEDPGAVAALANALLAAGIEAARAASRDEARALLEEAVALAPGAEEGWLWLAGVQKDREGQKRCLLRLLEINPGHPHARALLQRPEFRDEPRQPQQRCPICGGARQGEGHRCPSCRALLTLEDLPALLGNTEVDVEVVERAIRTREGLASWGGGVELHVALAFAHLNLGQLEAGLHHLKALATRRPSDTGLRAQIETLSRWQQAKERAAAGETPGAEEPAPADPGAAPSPVAAVAAPAAAPPTLLAIDDSATVRKLVASCLSPHGFRVLTAGSAAEGLSKLREHQVGLVLLDADLSETNGYQICRTIKSDPSTAHVPVVLMSGREGLLERRRGRKAGSSGHLGKPFEPHALLELARKTFR